jgi:hypothetical protein
MLSAPPTIPATFTWAFTPARPGNLHLLTSQVTQARPLDQRHHRHQASPRHQIRVIKRRVDLRQVMQQSHLRGVLSIRDLEVSATPIVPVRRAPFASMRPSEPLFTQWIQAKTSHVNSYGVTLMWGGDADATMRHLVAP